MTVVFGQSLKMTKCYARRSWRRAVDNPDDLLRVIGYIAGNLIKHQEIDNFEDLKKCPFSSYRQLAARYGDKIAEEMVERVILVEEDEDFILNL